MAWDALASRFQRKRTEEDKGMGAQAQPTTSGGGFSGGAPVVDPTGGFGGNAGSAGGGPVSAGFVNYAELYGANEEKAKAMASNAYRGAEKKAEGAKDALQTARDQFAGAVGAGTGRGPGAARLDSDASRAGGGAADKPWLRGASWQTDRTHSESTGSGIPWAPNKNENGTTHYNTANQDSQESTSTRDSGSAVGSARAGGRKYQGGMASKYESLFGLEREQGAPVAGQTVDASGNLVSSLGGTDPVLLGSYLGGEDRGLGDPHLSASELDAKSGAGQEYTGPGSIKDQLGEKGYSDLAEQFRAADEAVSGLQDAGGIAEALGYAGAETGNAAMDAGLTQTAGQAAFKKLKERYGGLGQSLADAQADSERAAKGAGIITDVAAADWQSMLDEYEKANAPKTEPVKDSAVHINYGEGSNAYALTKEAGFTAQELDEAYGDLTEEERAYLSRGANFFDNMTEYGFTGREAEIKQSIIAKLAKRRAAKKGGQ